MMDTHPGSSPSLNPTSDEEHIWLLQEQHPEQVLRQVHAWRLDDSASLSRVTFALQKLVDALPDLNARYHFTDEGELRKTRAPGWQPCLKFVRSHSRREAVEQLIAVQASPWQSAEQPPFQVLIIHTDSEVILGFVVHRILNQLCSVDDLAAGLIAAYEDRPVRFPQSLNAHAPWLEQSDIALLPALARAETSWTIRDAWSRPAATARQPLTLRWAALLPAQRSNPDDADKALTVAVRFARFVSRLGNHPTLGLRVHQPAGTAQALFHASAEQSCVVESLKARGQALTQGKCIEPLDDNAQKTVPWLDIHWRPSLESASLLAEPLPLPSAEIGPDLELELQAQADGGLRVTLSTGQRIDEHAGPLLLSNFLNTLDTDGSLTCALTQLPGSAPSPARHPAHDTGASAHDQAAIMTTILDAFRSALTEPTMQQDDDFFDFGGHSLLATRIIGKLAVEGIKLNFGDFFSAPTAAALAARATISRSEQPTTAPKHELMRAPFALAQASLGRAYQAFDFGTLFNLPFALTFLDPVDEALFEQAFFDLIERHASLRTTFHFEGDEAWQQKVSMDHLSNYKWFWNSQESRGATLASESSWKFDLSKELPMRVRFIADPQTGKQTLSLLVHHMAIDEWSLNVMMDELAIAYRARSGDTAPRWAAPAPSFHEFAARQQAEGINPRHLEYWTGELRDATRGLKLPTLNESQTLPAGASSTRAQWLQIRPEQDVVDGLYGFARRSDSSLFSVVYTAIALSLYTIGDLKDLIIGTSASGRTDPAFFDTVGYFTTMVAHRVQFEANQTVSALVQNVTRTINESMAYADVPLESIQQALGMKPSDGLLFDVYVQIHADNALNGSLSTADDSQIRYRQIDPEKNESMFGLQFEIMENVIDGQRLMRLVITYQTSRYSDAQIDRLNTTLSRILTRLATEGGAATALRHVGA